MLSHYEGLHVARGQRADGLERVDGARAPVSGDPEAAHAAGRRRQRRGRRRSPEANAVSILDRLRRSGHLDDAAIAQLWTRGRSAATAGAASTRISTPCAACRARFDAFAGWLDDVARRRDRRGRRGLPRRAPRRAAGADPAPARSARAPGAGHRVPAIRAPLTAPRPPRSAALDRRGRRRRPHRRRRRRPDAGPPPAHPAAASAGRPAVSRAGSRQTRPWHARSRSRSARDDALSLDDPTRSRTSPSVEALQRARRR